MSTGGNSEVAQAQVEPQMPVRPPAEAAPPPDLLPRIDDSPELHVVVHDSSRFEWQVILPLPSHGTAPYEVETEFEIPSNAVSARSPWDPLYTFTRLDADIAPVRSDGSLSAIRQKALVLARMLDRARKGFARHCHETIAHTSCEESHDSHSYLMTWLEAALRDETVCTFMPRPSFMAGPRHVLNGGIIATVIDCHCICTAVAALYKSEGRPIGSDPVVWCVTGSLQIDYLRPTPIAAPVLLRARVESMEGKRTTVACSLFSDGIERARGRAVAVKVPPSWRSPPPSTHS
jgi:acyl-coenzyme A thioesterase PaaI-like protein